MSNGFPYTVILWLLSIVAMLWILHRSRQQALTRRQERRAQRHVSDTQICGGCRGMGAHRRWCVNVVGLSASIRGKQAQMVENLADSVGSNNTAAANHLYAAAGLLNTQAHDARRIFQEQMQIASDLRDRRER